jgi:hypothetical protein
MRKLGCRLVALTGWTLAGAGLVALALASTTKLLPHDIAYLGMTVEELCGRHDCRVVRFLAHDRTAFGGSLLAIGFLYQWLARFPLRGGERWAWWTLLASGLTGFASFLAYLGYGYLDVWHGRATLALLPVFVTGLALARPRGAPPVGRPGAPAGGRALTLGRAVLVFVALGMMAAGATIMTVGMTRVFVPQDLEYMRLVPADLDSLTPRLVPLIAHDRAGFGGGLLSAGIALLGAAWCGARRRDPRLWWVLLAAGSAGFGTALGVHFLIGYTSFSHLAPAYAGAAAFALAIARLHGPMVRRAAPLSQE